MESFVVIGTWWFPDNANARFDAKLEFAPPHAATLTPTSDRFRHIFMKRYRRKYGNSFEVTLHGATFETPLLIGIGEGRKFSLLYCHLHAIFRVDVGLIIEGAHFDRVEETIFPAYSLSYSGLDEWGATGRLDTGHHERDGKTYFEISYEMPPSPSERTKIELKNVILEVVPSITFPVAVRNHGALTEKTEFRIVPRPSMTVSAVEVIETYSNLLRNFLMLTNWEYVQPLYLRAWFDAEDIAKGQASLYWLGKGIGLAIPKYKNDWLFTMNKLEDRLESVLQAWEGNWENFQPFIKNYFAHRYMPETFTEVQFLTYMQAMEGYHKKQNPKLKPKKGKRKVDLIDRLVDLLNPLMKYSAIAKITGGDPNAFVQPLIKVRNDLTHEAELKIPPLELARHNQKLELIILVVLFHSLGFSDSLIEYMSNQNVGFQIRTTS